MSELKFIVREPLLNAAQQILGYELSWFGGEQGTGMASDEDLLELVNVAAMQLQGPETASQLNGSLLFFEATPALIATNVVRKLPAKNTVFRLTVTDLADPETLNAAAALRQQGYGISLRGADAVSYTHLTLPTKA